MEEDYSLIEKFNITYNPNLEDIILIHPAINDAFVYTGLVQELSSEYNCIGLNNRNFEDNDYSLNGLANHYLEQYELDHSLKEPINLLGWSLGGQIALEMATILEKRGYKDINVTLLDTKLPSSDSSVSDALEIKHLIEEGIPEYISEMRKKEVEEDYIEKVVSCFKREIKLHKTPISSYLNHTSVLCFNATLERVKGECLKEHNLHLVTKKVEEIDIASNHDNMLDPIHAPYITRCILSHKLIEM